ncbi:hypothetical protein HUU05_28125 [candidate division KSB1 bacterium]|nr:hypothetical protein [candidate division KSB1 bacterium]
MKEIENYWGERILEITTITELETATGIGIGCTLSQGVSAFMLASRKPSSQALCSSGRDFFMRFLYISKGE